MAYLNMQRFVEQLRIATDIGLISIGDDIPDRYFSDWMTTAPRDSALALVRPRSTAEVSALLRICHAAQVPVVPQGGLTGLAGGAQPVKQCVLLSLELMKAIEEVDSAACSVTTQAGATLSQIQDIARDHDLFFPLDLGARALALSVGISPPMPVVTVCFVTAWPVILFWDLKLSWPMAPCCPISTKCSRTTQATT